MDTELARLLGLTGKRGVRSPAPTEQSAAQWRRLYDEAGSLAALARQVGRSDGVVRYHLMRHGIAVRGSGFRSPHPSAPRGANHYNWKGGTYYHSNGYIYEYAPDHPNAGRAKGYVLQHRLVVERALGRLLADKEIVHHINEDKTDNRIENLALTTRGEHIRGHKATAVRDLAGRFA